MLWRFFTLTFQTDVTSMSIPQRLETASYNTDTTSEQRGEAPEFNEDDDEDKFPVMPKDNDASSSLLLIRSASVATNNFGMTLTLFSTTSWPI